MNSSLHNEIASIRRMGSDRNIDGENIAFAFGGYFGHSWMDADGRNFLFDIRFNPESAEPQLLAEIDVYSAESVPETNFDVDTWEAARLHICAPPSRANFRELAQVCRGILSGRRIVFADGRVVQIKVGAK